MSISAIGWLHAGAFLSDNVDEPLTLAVDGCVPGDTNFTQAAIASFDTIMENDAWDKLYRLLGGLNFEPLAATFGQAGGFAVICSYLVRDILGLQHDFGSYRVDFGETRGLNDSDFSPVWIEVNQFERSGPIPLANLNNLRRLIVENNLINLVNNQVDSPSDICSPTVLSQKSAGSAEVASVIQQVANTLGDYLGYPCLGNIIYAIFDDNDGYDWNEENDFIGSQWVNTVLSTVSTNPHLKYGLRSLYLCVVNNPRIQIQLEEILTPLLSVKSDQNVSPLHKEICHIHTTLKNHGKPSNVMDILLKKFNLNVKHLEHCDLVPYVTFDINDLTLDEFLRIRVGLSLLKFYEEKDAKMTFDEHLVMEHLTSLQTDFLQGLSESRLVQYRNAIHVSPMEDQWKFDCLLSLVKIFEKPLQKKTKRSLWKKLLWWRGETTTKATKAPEKEFLLKPKDHEHLILETVETLNNNALSEADNSMTYTSEADSRYEEELEIVPLKTTEVPRNSKPSASDKGDKLTKEVGNTDSLLIPKFLTTSESSAASRPSTDTSLVTPVSGSSSSPERSSVDVTDTVTSTTVTTSLISKYDSLTLLPTTPSQSREPTSSESPTPTPTADISTGSTNDNEETRPAGNTPTYSVERTRDDEETRPDSTVDWVKISTSTFVPISQTPPNEGSESLSGNNNEYIPVLFGNLMQHDLVTTLIDLAAGTLSKDSAVYLIEMTLQVLYGHGSISPDYVIQDYMSRVKQTEKQNDDLRVTSFVILFLYKELL